MEHLQNIFPQKEKSNKFGTTHTNIIFIFGGDYPFNKWFLHRITEGVFTLLQHYVSLSLYQVWGFLWDSSLTYSHTHNQNHTWLYNSIILPMSLCVRHHSLALSIFMQHLPLACLTFLPYHVVDFMVYMWFLLLNNKRVAFNIK